MFVLRRNPMFTYYSRKKNPTFSTSTKNYQSNGNNTTYPFQILLSLTDINYVVTKVTTLLSTAWEIITYSWVTNLIQPDQYYHYDNIPNVFGKESCTAANTSNTFEMSNSRNADVVKKPISDEPSWGQFVDVDISTHQPLQKSFLQ